MVSAKIQPGLNGQKQALVCKHNVAGHVDKSSTPSMIGLIEQASIEAIHVHMEERQTSVGFEVNVRHLAPADIGKTIIAHAELTEIYRNCLTFQVETHNGETKIGEGRGASHLNPGPFDYQIPNIYKNPDLR